MQDSFAIVLAVFVVVIALGFAIATFATAPPVTPKQHNTETLQDSSKTTLAHPDALQHVSNAPQPVKPEHVPTPAAGKISVHDPSKDPVKLTPLDYPSQEYTHPTPANGNLLYSANIKDSYMLNIEPTDALMQIT